MLYLEEFITMHMAKKLLMFWGSRTSGVLHCGNEEIVQEDSKKYKAFIFLRVQISILMEKLAFNAEKLWCLMKSAIYDVVLCAVFSSSLLLPPPSAPVSSSYYIPKHTIFVRPLRVAKLQTHKKQQNCSSTNFNIYIIKTVNGRVRYSKPQFSPKSTSVTPS